MLATLFSYVFWIITPLKDFMYTLYVYDNVYTLVLQKETSFKSSVIFQKYANSLYGNNMIPPPSSPENSHRSFGPPGTNIDTITCSSPQCVIPFGPLLHRAPWKRGAYSGLSTLGQAGRLATALGRDLGMCVFVVGFGDKHRRWLWNASRPNWQMK